MKRVTASDLIRNFGEFSDVALNEPVIVTRNGRERLVLLNVDEYNYLRHQAADAEAAGDKRRGSGRSRQAASRKAE